MGSERSEPEKFGGVSKRSEAAQKIIAFCFFIFKSFSESKNWFGSQNLFCKNVYNYFSSFQKIETSSL
jgi:hypothetical protein